MADLNTLDLTGRLTRDPELRTLPSGDHVCQFRIAANGVAEDETAFVDVDVWGKQGEAAATYLRQGARVAVSGRLRIRDFTTREGEKGRAVECAGARVYFLESKAEAEARGQAAPSGTGGVTTPAAAPSSAPPPPPPGDDDIPF